MKIRIICVGKIKEKFYRDALAEYLKRLSAYCTVEVIELPDEKDGQATQHIIQTEGSRILEKIKDTDYVIGLFIDGKKRSSEDFANHLNELMLHGESTIDFIIGGSNGLSSDVEKRANEKLSFSDMTFPHQLMRVVLSEQIYRAFRIIKNEPYHK